MSSHLFIPECGPLSHDLLRSLVLIGVSATVAILAERTRRQRDELAETAARDRDIQDNTYDIIWTVDARGRFTYVSPNVEKWLGYTPDKLLGKNFRALIHPADLVSSRAYVDAVVSRQNGEISEFRYRMLAADGTWRWQKTNGRVIADAQGGFRHFLGFTQDITDQRKAETLLDIRMLLLEYAEKHSLQELLKRTLDEICELTESPIGFYHFVDEDQKSLSLQAWSTRTEREFCAAKGKGMHYPIDQAGIWVDCIAARHPVIHNDYVAVPHKKGLPPGHAAVIRLLSVPIFSNAKVVAILGVGNKPIEYHAKDVEIVTYLADVAWRIAERKRTEETLRESEHKYRFLTETISDILWTLDIDLKTTYVSPSIRRVLGFTPEERMRQTFEEQVTPDSFNRVMVLFLRYIKHGKQENKAPLADPDRTLSLEVEYYRKDGSTVWLENIVKAVYDKSGNVVAFHGVSRDVTERKKAEQTIRHLAFHDDLTGLPNRKLLADRFDIALSWAEREKQQIAVLMLDLDHFKEVNDTLGHPVGDELLKAVAERLSPLFRKGDTLARLGGDEFAMLFTELKRETDIPGLVRKVVNAFEEPFVCGDHTLAVKTSVGVALYPTHGRAMEVLMKNADIALYDAKREGRNRFSVYRETQGPVFLDPRD